MSVPSVILKPLMVEPDEIIESESAFNPNEASARIKDLAHQIGFHRVGLVRAESLNDESLRLQQWLARDLHGEMKWMARDPEGRANPRRLFPAAKSVVVVALNYYTAHEHDVARADSGKVSRYAWGDDYHDIVGEKLRELLVLVKECWPEVDGKVCVDIQPMMDKAWAVRAGLGWLGKHTNVITEGYGSWIFIGELLLNLELEYDDRQVADQCGSCTLCIDACPTGAIVQPYVLDSNRCISHATIESRAPEIRDDVAGNLDGWLYGCDICQEVCPWNAMTPTTDEPRFEPRENNLNTSLAEILRLTPESYAERFRGSAMKRAKLAGLQRNANTLLHKTPV